MAELHKEHPDIKVVFVSHLFGIPAPIKKFKKLFQMHTISKIVVSHMVRQYTKKIGTLSEVLLLVHIFGHHMTTEGGFVSTNDTDLYELMKAKT